MKHLKKINEEFDPMSGIDHFLNDPLMIILASAWLLSGKMKLSNLKSNLSDMKADFVSYARALGYAIDNDILDYKFNELIEKSRNILKNN